MRILFITPWYPTVSQPVAGVFVQRDAELMSTRHDVEVAHLVDPDLLSDADLTDGAEDIRVHRIPMKRNNPLAPFGAWRSLRSLIERTDVIHSHAFPALLPFAGHRTPRPWVHSEHWSGVANPRTFNTQGRVAFSLNARLLRRPDVVTAVSSYLLDRVRDHRRGPTMIVPSVVHPVEPLPAVHSADALRLVSVANLVEGKDPLLAVDTVKELRRRGVPAELRWVGEGPMRALLEDRIGPDSGVTLVGALDRTGVSHELNAAEIFLLPTRSETLCLSAIEAISHGRPVVIGAVGGQQDYVTASNGVLVTDRTPEGFADAVNVVAESFDRFRADDVAATVEGRFTPERVRELYEEAYATASSQHRNGHRA